MLQLHIVTSESYDETTERFVTNGVDLELEHSLASLSKWEAHFGKVFLNDEEKTVEETMWYIRAMITTPNFPPDILANLSEKNMQSINDYINSKQTATKFREELHRPGPKEIITAEVIHTWMVMLQIPLECQHWHLNRLFTLVRALNIKNSPPKKMSQRELMERNQQLNAQRQAQLGTRG